MSSQAAETGARAFAIDWFRVIVDLGRAGLSYRAIADRIGCGKNTVAGWANGAEPRHSDGQALLALWSERTGRPVSEAPVVGPDDWWSPHLRRPRGR